MINGLRVALILSAGILGLAGLGFLFTPNQVGAGSGFTMGPTTFYLMTYMGIGYVITSVFVLMAVKNPLKNIMWVRFMTILQSVSFLGDLYTHFNGYASAETGLIGICMDAVLTILLLVFYPWRAKIEKE